MVQRTTRSRRFVTKVMAMAVVAPPLLGLMRLAALAAKKIGQVLGKVNDEIKAGDWRNRGESRYALFDIQEVQPKEIRNIDDFDLSIFVPKGTEVEVDCTCDSKFMLKVMREVGMSIRNYFFWVP